MARLLIVHHTSSPSMQAMLEAVLAGAGTDEIEGVEVVTRPALTASAVDVLSADGYLLGTPANIGYMSGALKHFFDGIYYPCLDATQRRHYGLYVHGNNDTGGAVRAVEAITTGCAGTAPGRRSRWSVTSGPATWKRAGSWAPPSPRNWSRDPHRRSSRRPERHGERQLRGGGDRLGRAEPHQPDDLPGGWREPGGGPGAGRTGRGRGGGRLRRRGRREPDRGRPGPRGSGHGLHPDRP